MTKRYTTDHEWVSIDDKVATIGISAYAAEQLGDDIVSAEDMVGPGEAVEKGDVLFVFEKAKAAVEVYAPVSGEVIAYNDFLDGDADAFHGKLTAGEWIYRIRASDPSEADALMDEAAYKTFLDGAH